MKHAILMALTSVWLVATPVVPAEARQGLGAEGEAAHVLSVTPAPASSRALGCSLIPEAGGLEEGNAAPLYYQAMLVVAALPIEEQRALDEMGRADPASVDLARGNRIMTRAKRAFDLIELASRREACDWATPLQESGLNVGVPEAAHLQLLGAAIAARARLQIIQREREAALRTVGEGLALARHVARGPTILQALVAISIAERMGDQIELAIQTPGTPSLYWALAELGEHPVDVDRAVRAERSMLSYEVPGLAEIESGKMEPAKALDAMRHVLYPENAGGGGDNGWGVAIAAAAAYPKGRAALIGAGVPAEQVERWPVAYVSMRYHLARYLERRDELFKWAALPWWQARLGIDGARRHIEESKARGDGGMLLQLLPDIGELAFQSAQLERRFNVLRSVEALRAYAGAHAGEVPSTLDALEETPAPLDPATGRAFVYRMERGEGGAGGISMVIEGASPEPVLEGRSERMEYRVKLAAPSAPRGSGVSGEHQ